MKNKSVYKKILMIFLSAVFISLLFGCMAEGNDVKVKDTGDAEKNPETSSTAESVSESVESTLASPVGTVQETSSAGETAPPSSSDTGDNSETVEPNPAEQFFNGEWESSAGMIYIFDSKNLTVVLKEKDTGETLLEGTYNATSEDFNEFHISMTFHGETDSFLAWKYSDSGSVRFIIEETGKTYDMIWRIDS